jgi:hypothetical protein
VLDFFFGPDRRTDMESVRIGPRSYDIDVVEGVTAIMRQHLETQDKERFERYGQKQDSTTSGATRIFVEVRAPQLPGAQLSANREVPIPEVPALSRSERARIVVYGAQSRVDFVERDAANVYSSDSGLRAALENYLRAEGRRRVHWSRLASAVPATAGLALIPLWIVAANTGRYDLATIVFGSILAVGGFAAGIVTSRRLARRAFEQPKGHRFRESTRADFRAAVTSIRAGVLTSAGGTVLGVIATVVFYKLTGIDPV